MRKDYFAEQINEMTEMEIKLTLLEFLQNHHKVRISDYPKDDYYQDNQKIYHSVILTKKRKSIWMLLKRGYNAKP
ncbi:hypothetical protein [Fictibacillus sp. FJAT-27399]|uniref:hypothetical protein n=1 Tax=Fictibacillus sp. FJAT-27399 TaxID=1729689 RepID=UPI0007820E5C|nr:hypothetical protein [Fictibacillus sp. FJAT-27399]